MGWAIFWISWGVVGLTGEIIAAVRDPRGTLSMVLRWALGIDPHKPWRYLTAGAFFVSCIILGTHIGWGIP